MRGLATAVAATVGLCLWMAAPASAAEAPYLLAKTDPLETTCTNLKAEGVEIKVHNETGREREVKLTLASSSAKTKRWSRTEPSAAASASPPAASCWPGTAAPPSR